ncbi:hypothetical protein BRD12_09450 [Halobacteriales archaeon SW_12_67_38]|nr:MAG: hypothetical protein BRD12_09450 [Halobacteriales archaeon SW_12_67_38]
MADSNGPRQYGDERDRLQDSPITEADRRAVRGTITHMDGVDDLATSMINSRRLRADHHVRYEVNSSATHRAARDTIPHSTTGMMRGLRSSGMSRGPVAEVICRDVLFAHWPIAVDRLRPAVPSELTIETFDGTAWIGIVVVDIAEARVQRVPYRPSLSSRSTANRASTSSAWRWTANSARGSLATGSDCRTTTLPSNPTDTTAWSESVASATGDRGRDRLHASRQRIDRMPMRSRPRPIPTRSKRS